MFGSMVIGKNTRLDNPLILYLWEFHDLSIAQVIGEDGRAPAKSRKTDC